MGPEKPTFRVILLSLHLPVCEIQEVAPKINFSKTSLSKLYTNTENPKTSVIMPRHYVRKTNAGLVSHTQMQVAVQAVQDGMPLRKAAEEYNVSKSTLHRCSTVQALPKVLAPKGGKQVGQITSRERGELVTICSVVSADGSSLPPVYIFPSKKLRAFMMIGAPEGALGLATGNGWMNSEIFPKVLEHIIKHVRTTKERQIILIIDNLCSHLSLIARKMAKANFIHLITRPPHASNKTQPLDRTVFGLFKTFFNTAANGFMLHNPGKGITIYDMASLMSDTWTKAEYHVWIPGVRHMAFRPTCI
ncbi:tigger transposable element-derived protein [Elysia marginata]|uniref:Tigger transposable element-derived protein n=1 Tax=Elysia marginata TaxID=1093978 RepID=A0AAV4I9Q8_9GAST|nr:tigger transposable element-derived protein [Elysia marginata]